MLFAEGNNQELEIMAIDFIKEPGDRIQGPMVQTKLLRGTTIDMLVVKLSHLCSDGAGVKEYIKLLGTIYTHLSLGRSKKQIIKEFDEGNESCRDQSHVFKYAGISDIKVRIDLTKNNRHRYGLFHLNLTKINFPKCPYGD